jgi:hypothetical protein
MEIKQEYNGYTIYFNEEGEYWKTLISGEWQRGSLKEIKSYIDKLNKKDFKRIPIFFREYSSYGRNRDFKKAEITSIGLDKTVFIVPEGRKNAEHCSIAYKQTTENQNIILEIYKLEKEKKNIEELLNEKNKSLEIVDFEDLYNKFIKKDI